MGEVRQFAAFLGVVKCTILTLQLLSGHFGRNRSANLNPPNAASNPALPFSGDRFRIIKRMLDDKLRLKISLKPIYLTVASLLYASSVLAAGEREAMAKGDETKSRPLVINRPVAVDPGALLNMNVMPAAAGPAATQLALHEPVVKMPEMTIGGKVKPPRQANRKGKIQAAPDHRKHHPGTNRQHDQSCDS